MVTDKMIVMKVKGTGGEYAYPESRYSEITVMAIIESKPGHTNFHRSELVYMVESGIAEIIGTAKLSLDINYD